MSMHTKVVALAVTMFLGASPSVGRAEEPVAPQPIAPTLLEEFFLLTRECKQTFAEIGSSMEKPGLDLVNTTSALGYMGGCKAAGGGTFRCAYRLLDKAATFVSNSEKSLLEEYVQVGGEASFVVLLTLAGNSMYINPSSRDAVLISRQYVDFSRAKDGSVFGAVTKICKALYLSRAEFDEIIADKRKNEAAAIKAAATKPR